MLPRSFRLLVVALASALSIGAVSTNAATAEIVDPRYSARPPLVIAGDPSIPRPTKLELYSLQERSVVVEWRDGTPDEGRFEYEVLLDGRVLQRVNAGHWLDDSIPYRTTHGINTLEPGTSYAFGVRRVLPDERRSVTTTIRFTTPGTRLPASERPPVPVLERVRPRATSAALSFVQVPVVPGPYMGNISGYDIRMQGREIGYGMTSNGEAFITGLKPSTTYTIEARTRDLDHDTSPWVPVTFSTIAAPPEAPLPAPKPVVTAQQGRTVRIEWAPVYDAFGEPTAVGYRIDGIGEFGAGGEFDQPFGGGDFDFEKGAPDEPGRVYRVAFWSVDKDGKKSVEAPLKVTLGETPTTPAPPADSTPPAPAPTEPARPGTSPVTVTPPEPQRSPSPQPSLSPQPNASSQPSEPATQPSASAPIPPQPPFATLAASPPQPAAPVSLKAQASELSKALAQSLDGARLASLRPSGTIAAKVHEGTATLAIEVRDGKRWTAVARGKAAAGATRLVLRSAGTDRSRAVAARTGAGAVRARVVVRLSAGAERVVSTRGFTLRR